jgi:hypothetical protein
MSSDSKSTTPGTLIVQLPQWAATVRVYDNLSQMVGDAASPTPVGNGLFEVRKTLSPGAYNVEVMVGSSADNEWVSVRPGKDTVVPSSRWEHLHLASAAPLQQRDVVGPTPHAAAAEQCSHTITWKATQPGNARLFIFVQTPDSEKYPNFAHSLSLLAEKGQTLTALAGDAIAGDAKAGWMSFVADLPQGFYILSRSGPDAFQYNQPLYLCDHWETQLFLFGGKGPSLRSLTVHMAPLGAGFRRDDETATASDAVLSALTREFGMRAVIGSSELNRLLRGEQRNPWLAVLTAHGLMAIEDEARRDRAPQQTSRISYDPTLKQEVIQFLQHTIGDHPDVRALSLDPNAPAPQSFLFPPMLRVGLRRVREHATKFAETIPYGSLTDRLCERELTSSAWSVWRQPLSTAREARTKKKDGNQRRVATAVLRAGFSPYAPIFIAPSATQEESGGLSGFGRILEDLPVIKAAENFVRAPENALPEKIRIDSGDELKTLFKDVDPRAFSVASGIPLARAEKTVERLRQTAGTEAQLGDAGPSVRAAVEFALRQWSHKPRSSEKSMADAPASTPSQQERTAGVTLEECASQIRAAATQLTSTAQEAQENQPDPRASDIASRLDAIADALLDHANLIAITGADGKLLYGNGAFALLLTKSNPQKPLHAGRQWSRWLSGLPLGRTQSVRAEFDPQKRSWTIHRAEVEYAQRDQRRAFVNVLEDNRRTQLPAQILDAVSAKVSEITLHASLARYASSGRMSASLDKLASIVSELERKVGIAQGQAQPASEPQRRA